MSVDAIPQSDISKIVKMYVEPAIRHEIGKKSPEPRLLQRKCESQVPNQRKVNNGSGDGTFIKKNCLSRAFGHGPYASRGGARARTRRASPCFV
jgi:hypothetical protein